MQLIHEISALQEQIRAWRKSGETIAFVPTMGNLHGGHFALVKRAQALGSKVVVSIFINPAQFNRPEDLAAYPKTLDSDCTHLSRIGTDLVFAPSAEMMYPTGQLRTKVEAPGISDVLEGEKRPGHFTGVATIVAKLFNIVQPDVAVFGEKDFQQLLVVRQMVRDLDLPVKIEGVTAVREDDGLAMSSRNGYLTSEERLRAPFLHETLQEAAAHLLRLGSQNSEDYLPIQQIMMGRLAENGFRPEYFEVRRSNDLQPPQAGDENLVILVSAWLGKARLIDNVQVFLRDGRIV
ncbi:pantoate--beta-alanine ligase [Thiolinea disciformis]|uniref:pantoate--beta-alanine ligase n=1 Tax=Thiolinea disciformis TaxID=125614 RepID=UPI000367D31F|nr:pantoate--beta-alanine ligase [Thiolinea disciformis]